MTEPICTQDRAVDPSGVDRTTRSRYAIIGAILGVLWYVNDAGPLWEHAVCVIVIMFAVLVVLELVNRRRHGGADRPRISHGRIIATKLVFLAVAIGAQWLLDQWTDYANVIVAVGLAVVVAVAGPRLQHHLVRTPGQG
jgi:phosphatidylglycerophosphate synthase